MKKKISLCFPKSTGFRNSCYDERSTSNNFGERSSKISWNYGGCRCWYVGHIFQYKQIQDNCIHPAKPYTWFRAFEGCMCECQVPAGEPCPRPPYTCGCEISPGTYVVC